MLHQNFPPQDFDVKGGPEWGRKALPKIRAHLREMKVDGFYLPHDDEYLNEYLPACNERLAFATGFTGSAGAAFIGQDIAAIFADGRYTLQASVQTDPDLFARVAMENDGTHLWLRATIRPGMVIGYDPSLMSPESVARIGSAVEAAGGQWRALAANPVDLAWGKARPAEPLGQAFPHPDKWAGEPFTRKCARIGAALAASGADCALLTSPISVAWLLNLRGEDIARTPVPLCRAILHADGSVDLFMQAEKLTPELRKALGLDTGKASKTRRAIRLSAPEKLPEILATLKGRTVSIDPGLAAAGFFEALHRAGARVLRQPEPTALPRACKNATEIRGAKAAHLRDGALLTQFLHWLAIEAPKGGLDEISAAEKLEKLRRQSPELRDLSFDTISGAAANGASPHYRVNRTSNLKLRRGTLYLVDSGAQYGDGTTDVTRTIAVGEPTSDMRRHFTLVLKGHIALSTIRFPKGVSGLALDALARMALWNAGLDYDHGTGHGVGSFLSVHEGPQRIAKFGSLVPLEPGMIISNEPGFYLEGQYGIRIENLQFVTPPSPIAGGDRDMMGFETLTLAPLDRTLIEPALLSREERRWVNAYHMRVRRALARLVPPDTAEWLRAVTAPLPAR